MPFDPTPKPLLERWLKFIRPVESGCWLWTGYISSNGYGKMTIGKTRPNAHIVGYKLYRGPVPDDLELDHLCRVRACVNPDHLEAVTHRENVLRGIGITARQTKRTHCPQGHPYDTINKAGARRCKTCKRDQMRAHRLSERIADAH